MFMQSKRDMTNFHCFRCIIDNGYSYNPDDLEVTLCPYHQYEEECKEARLTQWESHLDPYTWSLKWADILMNRAQAEHWTQCDYRTMWNCLRTLTQKLPNRADLVIARRTMAQHAWSDDPDLFNGIPTLWVGYGYFDRDHIIELSSNVNSVDLSFVDGLLSKVS